MSRKNKCVWDMMFINMYRSNGKRIEAKRTGKKKWRDLILYTTMKNCFTFVQMSQDIFTNIDDTIWEKTNLFHKWTLCSEIQLFLMTFYWLCYSTQSTKLKANTYKKKESYKCTIFFAKNGGWMFIIYLVTPVHLLFSLLLDISTIMTSPSLIDKKAVWSW